MTQLPRTPPRKQGNKQHSSLVFFCIEVFAGILLCAAFVSGVSFGLTNVFGSRAASTVAHAAQPERHVQVNLKIVLNQPGYQQDWPAYTPSTVVVPANSLVTVTIRNYDLGDTELPLGSPFGTVQGVEGGVAYTNGHPYMALALNKVAHTFTVPQLHISVPVPGDAPKGMPYAETSFTFRTGAAGSYYFRCFDPCGTGSSGWEGPMLTKGYMLGTLIVQA
jgi:hypothetical protein